MTKQNINNGDKPKSDINENSMTSFASPTSVSTSYNDDSMSSLHLTQVVDAPPFLGVEVSDDDVIDKKMMFDEEAATATEPPSSGSLTTDSSNRSDSSKSEDDDDSLKSTCLQHPRVKEMYSTADWWSLWIGLLTFGVAMTSVFAVPLDQLEAVKYVVPQPYKWEKNPLDAWDAYNLIGIPILLLILMAFYLAALRFMGKLNPKSEEETRVARALQYTKGFVVMSILAVLALWLGSNTWASSRGLGYAVFAILLGMVLGNTILAKPERLPWLLLTARDGEFFIKCSLTLLAVELNVLVSVGAPGMLVAWIGSPLAITLGFFLGMRLFGCQDSLSMIIAVGAAWCGASAISAVAPVVSASSEDVTLAISVVAFFTVIFTFAQPYIAMAVGMPDDIAGSWIGSSVDQTGNVIVSAAIISEEATEVAGIVKMVLNAGLGIMASVVSCYWNSRRKEGEEGKEFRWIMLWDKFPKFTLGFVITSAILTGTMQAIPGTLEAEALPSAISTMNKWWFSIAFVGIGCTTNVKTLFEKAWSSGVIQVYLLANTIDILLSLGLSYLAYGVIVD
ncbi:MAG: hypothetical protein SGILL_007002 [Bacillariaceae sp.]